jgi:hypothetical protein
VSNLPVCGARLGLGHRPVSDRRSSVREGDRVSPLKDHPNEERQKERKGELQEGLGLNPHRQTSCQTGNQGDHSDSGERIREKAGMGLAFKGSRAKSHRVLQGCAWVRLGIVNEMHLNEKDTF